MKRGGKSTPTTQGGKTVKLIDGLTVEEHKQYKNGFQWCTVSEVETIVSNGYAELEAGETLRDWLIYHLESLYIEGYIPSMFEDWAIIKKYKIKLDDIAC